MLITMLKTIKEFYGYSVYSRGFRKTLVFTLFIFGSVFYVQAAEINTDTKGKIPEEINQAVSSPNDQNLTEAVRTALKETVSLRLLLTDVQIKTVNGDVHLKGTVASEKEKHAIEEKVRTCPNVTQIRDYIRVAQS